MKMPLRTVWLEISAGFLLLFAAVSTYAARGGVLRVGPWSFASDIGASLLILAACAVFLLHPVRVPRALRRGLFLFAAAVASSGAAWFLTAGTAVLAIPLIGYAAWLFGGAFVPWCDRGITAVDDASVRGFHALAGAILAAIGILRFLEGGASWHAAGAAALSVVAGAAMVWIEIRAAARARLTAALLSALAFLYHGTAALGAGDVGTGGALISLFALLLIAVAVDPRLPEAADDLSGVTPRQREIYAYERAGEMTLWGVAAASTIFVNYIDVLDARSYFSAILAIALVTQYSYRLRPAAAISERRYLLTLAAVIVTSVILIVATGGALGPFVSLAYLAIFAGTVIIRPIWSIGVAVFYAGYVAAEYAWHAFGHDTGYVDGHAAEFWFLATTLLFTGIYTAWTGRRRARTDEALLAANRRLAEALRNAVRERERYERQAQDLKSLNENLIEMRSALMNVLEDVEESKRQIEAERRREVASFNALAEGVIAAGKDGRVFLCNPTASRILGVPVDVVIGSQIERVLRLFHEQGAVMQTGAFEQAYAGKTAALGDRLRLSRADGVAVPVSGTVAPYLDQDDRMAGIVVAFRDVTIEREIDRQKSDFISIASHQLRTPLSAMRWFLDLLLGGDAGPLKPAQKEYLVDMSASVVRMVKLVGDLLNISRIESGQTKPNPERVDTAAFVDSLVREFAPLVRQQEVVFTHAVAKDAGVFYADPSLARQALSNVISNAVKYTPAGGSVTLEVSVQGAETVFKVKDTGLGIPKDQQYRVYDKFFRGENVVSRETVGSGLGLYVVKSIIELSGGRIWFESTEKKGTTFHLTFPNGPSALPEAAPGGTIGA